MRYVWTVADTRWKLPVTVDFGENLDVINVRLAELPFSYRKKEKQVLVDKLNAICFNRNEKEWFFLKNQLQQIARPFEGTDIEDAVEWRPTSTAVDPPMPSRMKPIEEIVETRELLLPMVTAGIWKSIEAAEMIWNLIRSRIQDRLINEQKPVHFGFCRLYALPYRVNWKQIMFQFDAQKRFTKVSRNDRDSIESIMARKIPHAMIEERLTAWNIEEKHVEWTLEVVPTFHWDELVRKAEREKRRLRRLGYFTGVVDTMKRVLPFSLDVYRDYLQRIYRPIIVMGKHCEESGGRRHKKESGASIQTADGLRTYDESISLDPADVAAEGIEGLRNGSVGKVRAMFRFPSTQRSLRLTWHQLYESEHGGSETVGMPVQDEIGREVPGQELLDVRRI